MAISAGLVMGVEVRCYYVECPNVEGVPAR
jgi:hypothetical protein